MFIREVSEIKRHTSLNINIDFELIESDIRSVTEEYLSKYLGDEFVNELQEQYKNGSIDAYLLHLLQRFSINMAFATNLPISQVDISNSGIRIETEDNKKTAGQWRISEIREKYFYPKAYACLDMLLKIVVANKDKFTTWNKSVLVDDSMVPDLASFEKHYKLGGSNISFYALREEIDWSEELVKSQYEGVPDSDLEKICVLESVKGALDRLSIYSLRSGLKMHLWEFSDSFASMEEVKKEKERVNLRLNKAKADLNKKLGFDSDTEKYEGGVYGAF